MSDAAICTKEEILPPMLSPRYCVGSTRASEQVTDMVSWQCPLRRWRSLQMQRLPGRLGVPTRCFRSGGDGCEPRDSLQQHISMRQLMPWITELTCFDGEVLQTAVLPLL
jgi:hypothetical protein